MKQTGCKKNTSMSHTISGNRLVVREQVGRGVFQNQAAWLQPVAAPWE